MTLGPHEWAILGVAVVTAVFGLFIGFSGSVAFLAGSAGALLAGKLTWTYVQTALTEPWMQMVATGVAALVGFGVVRIIVRKIVKGLLAQPGDAILGALVSGATGGALAFFAVKLLGLGAVA